MNAAWRSHLAFLVLIAGVLWLACLTPGCASLKSDSGEHMRDGVRYGVTQGRFRGRWWNYYERGRSFLEGGYYAEAARDFRTALGNRSKDQLWPRIYGLHFIPEYFPQRELGVTRYYQQDLAGAEEALQASLSQQFSARAAYFLDQVRLKRIAAAGGDQVPPAVEFEALPGAAPVHALSLEVAGRARDDYYVARVEVGGQQVAVLQSAPELPFRVTVPIGPGTREVPVIVTDLAGHVATASLPLETDLDGPAVSLDAPADDGTRAGVVFDPAGIKRLAVNGQDIPLSPVDETTATFTLPGEMVNASTAFVCEDQLDNRTVGKFDQDPAATLSAASPAASWAVAPPLTRWLTYWPQVFFGAQPEPVSPLRISFEQMEEGQEFYAEEILVTLRVSSDAPLAALSLNDIALPLPAGRHSVLLSRRFALLPGQNTFAANARDAQDRTASEARNIMRAETQIEATAGRLNVAFLGNILPAPDPDTTALADTVFDTLPSFPRIQNRFSIVDRALLTPILAEQQLAAALASAESRLALGRLIPAEVMFAGRVRQDAESIEIVLDGASTETGARLTGRVEVAGAPANLESLLDDLSLRLVQEFPRVKGLVIQRDARGFLTDLGRKQGLKNSYKCLVYRTEKVTHPVTGQSLGERPLQIYQGVIQSVDEGFSSGALLPLQDSDDVAAYDVQVNDYVLTK